MPRKFHRTSVPLIQRINIHPVRNSCLLEVQSRVVVPFTLSNMVAGWGVRTHIIHSPNQFEGIDGRMSLKLNENMMRADICSRVKQPPSKRVSRLNHEVAEACSFSIPLQICFGLSKVIPELFPSTRNVSTLLDVVDLEPDARFVAFRGRRQLQSWIKAGRPP